MIKANIAARVELGSWATRSEATRLARYCLQFPFKRWNDLATHNSFCSWCDGNVAINYLSLSQFIPP